MYRVLPCVAVLSLALIAGCGGSASGGAPADDDGTSATGATTSDDSSTADANKPLDADVAAENQIADCMKAQGFQYLPHPENYGTSTSFDFAGSASLVKPDSVVRKWREKYGFGDVAAQTVFPNDPQVKARTISQDPNKAIVAKLDPAKRKAYNRALTGYSSGEQPDPKSPGYVRSAALEAKGTNSCWGKAEAKREASFTAEKNKTKAADHKLWVRYQNDTKLKAAGQKYANCLKNHGHQVQGDDPMYFTSTIPPVGSRNQAGRQGLTMSLAAAKKALAKEITFALDDVDCRGPYATIMRSNYPDIALGKISEGGAG